jgi:hypothetical protein
MRSCREGRRVRRTERKRYDEEGSGRMEVKIGNR